MTQPPLVRIGLLFALLALACLHLLVIVACPYLNHDVAQYLSAGQIVAEGGLPYVDVIDTNPPTIIYLSTLPALIADALQLPLAATGLCFWSVVIFATLGFIGWMSKEAIPDLDSDGLLFSLAIWVLLSLLLYLESVFAQRDELAFLFLTPFLLARLGRYQSLALSRTALAAAGIMAAVAVAMKPVFLLVVITGEAGLAFMFGGLNIRLKDLEVLFFAILFVLLEVHTFIVPAMASQSVYWIVRTLRGYHAYNSTFSETLGTLLTGNAMISLVIVFGLIIIRIIGRNGQAWRAGALFGFAGVANAAVALVQLKGWIYHTVPLILSAGFGAALFCAALLRPLSTRNRQIVYLAGILVLSSLLLFPYLAPMAETAQSGRLVRLPESEMTHLIREYTQPADRVMVLDTGVGGGYPDITYTGRRPAGRFLSAFPIAFVSIGSREYLPAPDLREDAERYNAMLKEDLAKDRPALIFISASAGATALPKGFRITEYLKSHGVYALLREDYDPMGVCGDFEVFRRRRSGTPGEQKQSRTD